MAPSEESGISVQGDVSMGGGDFVGRDKIEQLIERMDVQGDYVERQDVTNVFLVAGPQGVESLAAWMADKYGLKARSFQDAGLSPPSESHNRQIEEIQAAQREATARGVSLTPQAAYKMGMLAAYRRDYDSALNYFSQAVQARSDYSDAFEAITWLQQSLAMDDLNHGDYDAAIQKLAAAREAAIHTDPLDAGALTLRGYIDKTLAQIYHARGDLDAEGKHYAEAERFFEAAVGYDSQNASAYNGLGNVLHARGELDAAIDAYEKAIEKESDYTAAWHDLALAFEDKMRAEPRQSRQWAHRALEAWRETYRLAPDDPGFSAEHILKIGQRVRYYEGQLGEG